METEEYVKVTGYVFLYDLEEEFTSCYCNKTRR